MAQNELNFIAVGLTGSGKSIYLLKLKKLLEDDGYEVTRPETTSDSGKDGNLPAEFILARK